MDADPAGIGGGVQDGPLGGGGALVAAYEFSGAGEGFGHVVVRVGDGLGEPRVLDGQAGGLGLFVGEKGSNRISWSRWSVRMSTASGSGGAAGLWRPRRRHAAQWRIAARGCPG
ncbi:hypothetical protein Phou_100290 [Phytohabitans houttuyneae]|uniref:Uncharacterized protein n=1 Tax=Phytohabitans houttuyneae TaxID=1076126 RepID=A0A6V8KU62_9ACTN|nr:hypothetical protein Phou_100290 [Phytohabitans houttuyneae]